MAIQLYNTMAGKKEPLVTMKPGEVSFYACGPTVYNYFHIGNARMFVVFDTIRRYLEYRGYTVHYVQNFTDVDDKIIQRSIETGEDVRTVANKYIGTYFEDAGALAVQRATVHPRVTENIEDIIDFIAGLIQKGHAYVRDGSVYFDTSSFPEYGKLSHQLPDEMRSGFRIEVNEKKDDPTDFALWKAAKPNEEYWDSPWGPGRPGWHIECSVMSRKYLGEQIDIHAGGRDLIFPHHENEIAQSESYSGKPFARYWVHNGTLNINGEKMSKSLGNYIMTRDLLQRRSGRAIRFFLLSAQYRHPLNYTEDAMDQAEKGLERIDRSLLNLQHRKEALAQLPLSIPVEPDEGVQREAVANVRAVFILAMDDDFNTADAIAALFEVVRQANSYVAGSRVSAAGLDVWIALLAELAGILGIEAGAGFVALRDDEISRLLEERNDARKRRDFQRSDDIRDHLADMGIYLEDTAQGTRWYRK